jgi:hypothetical protein
LPERQSRRFSGSLLLLADLPGLGIFQRLFQQPAEMRAGPARIPCEMAAIAHMPKARPPRAARAACISAANPSRKAACRSGGSQERRAAITGKEV